ncbi:hypothetical protein BSK71_07770 [Pectobacterium actinidiae]|uniref:Uncharacterized protein n=1 Tax=Pectobacterium actinidiae TaxID=1507808 RepID=A0A1V2R542_9GAMM|nr:hypothetical protein BSK69_07490 [Pectobacterium actinidiae]ONK07569.1 hypothetical protein BSK71_07770 [Pectobacterium actinidiae]
MNEIVIWIKEYRLDSIFTFLSAICWLISSLYTSRTKPNAVILSMGEGKKPVDMHNLVLSMQTQAKWNRFAAFFASIGFICQTL